MQWWSASVVLIALIAVSVYFYPSLRRDAELQSRVDTRQGLGQATYEGRRSGADAAVPSPCGSTATPRPYVLLALGQSNAGNHGMPTAKARGPITMVWDGRCISAQDPLPGATGTGESIWPRLVAALARKPDQRPVVMSILAVDSSSIDDWTRDKSPLRGELTRQLASLKEMNLPPDAILWQQGETDARDATTAEEYAAKLDLLAGVLTRAGIDAPVFLARSTVCRTSPSLPIRDAIERKITQGGRWKSGPDTDRLNGPVLRRDGCHFSAAGLDAAAGLWAAALACEKCIVRN